MTGKVAYLSPEQARGRPPSELGPPHVVFGLAAVLAELLRGQRLFRGDSDFEILKQTIAATLPSPVVPAELAGYERLEPLLRRALAADPAQRHPTPAALAADLDAAPRARADEIAAWLQRVAGDALASEAALLAKVEGVHAPPGGYHVLAQLAASEEIRYLAVRDREPHAVLLERMVASDRFTHVVVEEKFLVEGRGSAPGLAGLDDVGTDTTGAAFRVRPYVHGVALAALLRAHGALPPAIALAVVVAAARALDGRGIPRRLTPWSVRITPDGRPIWTGLVASSELADIVKLRERVAITGIERPPPSSGPPGRIPRAIVVRRR